MAGLHLPLARLKPAKRNLEGVGHHPQLGGGLHPAALKFGDRAVSDPGETGQFCAADPSKGAGTLHS